MSLSEPTLAAPPSPRREDSAIFQVGTLRYTKSALYVLFFWLMWNDFSIMFLEQVNSLGGIFLRNLGASYTEMGLIGTIGMIGFWINPVFSIWSDRHRGRLGRRRPFLFATTPFLAVSLMSIPFMPDLYHFLMRFPWAAAILSHLPMDGPIFFVAVASIIYGLFNTMVLTVFSYLYWDVVPEIVLGRFTSLSSIANALAGFTWNFFFFGYGEHHMKGVYMGVSMFCLIVYLTSVWQIKEGDYPPPDEQKKGGILAPVRAYFIECYSKPYYLWIFAAFTLMQIGNGSNNYRTFYLHYDLKLSLDEIGKASSLAPILITVLGFFVGTLTDRLKPMPLMTPLWLLWSLTNVASYFFVHDQLSFLICFTVMNLVIFFQGVVYGALVPEMYPREKLGQFCSAAATMMSVVCGLSGPFIGMFFDYIHYNRICFLWSAFFQFAAALVFVKVHSNWRKLKGHAPVPHAG